MKYSLAFTAGLVSLVSAHGNFKSPAPRGAGSAMAAACGQQVFNQQKSDNGGNIQGELQNVQSDFKASDCNLWLCKGYQFADNTANVHSFTAGQVVPLEFEIRAPHAGVANVSIVDTKTNTIIGQPLISFASYADNSRPTQDSEQKFSVTIPSDLGSKCATAGACVIQHFWDARSVDQTYASCLDFTVGGSGSSPAPAPTSAAPASTAAAPKPTTAVPATTVVSAPASEPTDDSCDAEDPAESSVPTPVAVSSAAPAEPTDDSCDADEPVETAAPVPTTLVTRVSTAVAAPTGSVGTASIYQQCGGNGFKGPTACAAGLVCKKSNDYYSQCLSA